MEKITDIYLNTHCFSVLKKVAKNCTPILITREKNDSVVMLSLKGYEAIEKLIYAMENPIKYHLLLKQIQEKNNDQ